MPLETYDQRDRDNFIATLKQLLDWYEQHPDMPAPPCKLNLGLYATSKDEFIELRRVCGLTDKWSGDDDIGFVKEMPYGHLLLFTDKQHTCRRIKTGERIVPEQPAQPARIEPVYEWVCDEPLLA